MQHVTHKTHRTWTPEETVPNHVVSGRFNRQRRSGTLACRLGGGRRPRHRVVVSLVLAVAHLLVVGATQQE